MVGLEVLLDILRELLSCMRGCVSLQEECRGWDINEVVFDPSGLWGMYQPMLRADFRLFDEYEAVAAVSQPAFRFPLTTFWGDRDRRVTEQLVQVSDDQAITQISGRNMVLLCNGLF
jgi:surfactin synthase thioesterase subunit